jgi:hypothetical protein
MKIWNLKSGDPGAFSIASDVRCVDTDYTNDHIWEVALEGGEPPALAFQTTFGLRARNLRLFPRFVEGDTAISDPTLFSNPPTVHTFYPNYINISFSPLTGIEVKCEYWVPTSHVLSGRIQVTNSRLSQRKIKVQWAATLSPTEGGQRMAPEQIEATTVLCGKTEDLNLVVFMTGGPEVSAGPYPALSLEMDLAPGGTRQVTWVQAASESRESSFELARQTVSRSWDGEIARLEVLNERLRHIETGDPDWDAAFALTQKNALGLLVSPSDYLPKPSFVLSRQPVQGYSALGDGSDYGHLWNGQTPLEADFISSSLLPGEQELVKGFLSNFLATQTKSGFIDFKPGLAGQRSRLMATPILANFAWRIYQTTEDKSYLEEVYPHLLSFVQAWFNEQQDRDGDGLPEWSRSSQAGFEDHPTFSQWQAWSQGGDISKVESSSLCALLYNEINLLIQMAGILDRTSTLPALEAIAENLKNAVEASWDDSDSTYRNWDRESHFSPKGEHLGDLEGPGEIQIDREFKQAIRLSIQVDAVEEFPGRINIFIHGVGQSGNQRIERIDSDQFRWHLRRGNVSTERIYTSVEYVEVIGVGPKDRTSVEVMDLSVLDQTLFLPLWAGIPDEDRAERLINNNLTRPSSFWKPYGIAACNQEAQGENHPCVFIHMVWNNLIGEGLLRYGYREAAAELVTKLMEAVIKNLKTNNGFYHYYHAETGQGLGERNALGGLAPLNLFMETLGVRILSPTKVYLFGRNPFPWQVNVSYRGLKVQRGLHKTTITFPGGQLAVIKTNEPRMVTLE